ncbi:MAG: HNH endonuclease signature motif containing protein [archaeon]
MSLDKLKLSRTLRNSILVRDRFTCQKCKLEDKAGRELEVHHIKPIIYGGTNDKENLIALCNVCHRYAPNKLGEFEEYMGSECDGQMTLVLKAIKIVSDQMLAEGKYDLFKG